MKSLFIAVFLTLAGLALPVTSVGQESSMFRIAYIEPSPSLALCIADASTTARVCLTESQEGKEFRDLAWSPNGTMIAIQQELFRNGENIGGQLLVIAADGSDKLPGGQPSPNMLSGSERVGGKPMWSNDSKEVAIFGGEGILIARVADGSRRTISLDALSGLLGLPPDIAWSPDNKHFALGALDAELHPALVLIDADDGSAETLVEFTDSADNPGGFNDVSWSPDGGRLLFTRTPPCTPGCAPRSQHWIVNADGTNPKMLYDSGAEIGNVMEAQFSPIGDTIAFDGVSGGVVNIFLMQSDGSNIRQLTHSAVGAFTPRWWPGVDTHILYFDSETVTMNIVTTGIEARDGVQVRTLFPGMDFEWAPVAGPLPPGLITPQPTGTSTPTPAATPTGVPTEPTPVQIPPSVAIPSTGDGVISASDRGLELVWALSLLGIVAILGGTATSLWWHSQRH